MDDEIVHEYIYESKVALKGHIGSFVKPALLQSELLNAQQVHE